MGVNRPARGFLLRFGVYLVLFYLLVAIRPVNDHVIVPFTGGVARASGWLLNRAGEKVHVDGTVVSSERFGVNIENGCNGVETALMLAAAILAFPAPIRARIVGFLAGFLAIELVNLVRVLSLFWIGVHRNSWFNSAHTLVWQSVVVLFGVGVFVFWAARVPKARAAADAS
jgi:exosortase H (IPTLxxWG-CTERM-specific)